MEEDKRVNMKLTMLMTDSTGQEMFSSDATWKDVPYAGAVLIQEKMVNILSEMTDLGYDVAAQIDPQGLAQVEKQRKNK